MKRTFPLVITALAGFVLIISSFIPVMESLGREVAVWFDVLASIAFLLGGGNLLRLQLQNISDKRPGWGYSAVTLLSFLIVLWLGMFKIGSPPEPNVERYGTSLVRFPATSLPETRVPGTLVQRADGQLLPAEVRPLLRQEGPDVVVRGWLTPPQVEALMEYEADNLTWQVLVQALGEQAVPPADLQDQLSYDSGQTSLAWDGYMSPVQEQSLLTALGGNSNSLVQQAVTELAALARAPTEMDMGDIPGGFVIPESAAEWVKREGTRLSVSGPISVPLREQIALRWSAFPRVRPLTPEQLQGLRSQLDAAGSPLTTDQEEVFNAWFAGDWTADQLIQALNTAGAPPAAKKTPRELQAELRSGVERPDLNQPAPTATSLNPAQEQAVRDFVANPQTPPDQLREQLSAAGTITPAQLNRVNSFLASQPTVASHRHGLAFKLLGKGPLSAGQRELLLAGARDEFRWRQQVGRLFIAAHRTKYAWAGAYDAGGTPFWWMYEYIFQPLTTTTFAVLAFYVASAAFRAFRAKNLEAVLLLGTAFIILLGRTFLGQSLTSGIPDVVQVGGFNIPLSALRIDQMTGYIMSLFTTAGNRAIMIGIALGTISTSLQVLLGIDRSYLGRGDD